MNLRRQGSDRQGHCAAILIGGSAGAIQALPTLLRALPSSFAIPVIVVLHRLEGSSGPLHQYLGQHCELPVLEIHDKAPIRDGTVYLAPAGYHSLIEDGRRFALSIDRKVNYSRPSIDVLFDSAVSQFAEKLVGVILTGANADGAAGLRMLGARGGTALVQDPAEALADFMPKSALMATPGAQLLSLDEIARYLVALDLPAEPMSIHDEI